MGMMNEKLSALAFAFVEENGKTLNVTVPKENLYEAAVFLRKECNCDFLMDIVGIDYTESLGTIYYLSNTQNPAQLVALKTSTTDREDPLLDSVHDLWDSAGLYEREVHDFLGIRFINHPDMRRLFLRQDWKGYPLRKDYDANPALNPVPLENELIEDMEAVPAVELKMGQPVETIHKLFEEDEYIVNFGPQHPATHGVLHLRVSLEGEIVKKIDPNFGYIHRGIEKMSETYTYPQILHLTDRLDYLSGTINRHAVCLCCEKALKLEVPERAHYIRTIFDELTRIASHLLGWGCMAMDMGSITAFVYGMRDREKIMDIFEETSGGRLMANYSVIGGVAWDIHPNFQRKVKELIPYLRKMLKEHHLLFTGNPIARGRMEGVGHLSKEQVISLGATGPSGRASGWSNDIRKIEPYAAYRRADFNEVLRQDGMTFDRYIIRLDEILESLNIIEQLIDNIPEGPYAAKTKAIIRLPEGEFFQRVENARGEFDVYINSKGDKSPYRIKFRSPCLTLVNSLIPATVGSKVADLIMIGASLDYVVPCIDR
ncbi:MAG: NADH-quinone oxidoreductase subunit D [Dysgonamonadaceae bacterium]|jgi:NADH-quinone oxidoreductase subunit C/D|nr:NADH-quinone oxidoreductase subunit D [Dysgonamonadaceae bacterium]